ncbi:MAG: multicopper oxidase domain-containing protein [Candidatus Omnitrophota bacterium]|nr:multicopper oxidase domain-containing protein [Candidatus Omnitrophota bacterium]MDZ4242667.1 multicopper oxidase domain-containing protein [Candidatus Omnitrophota bacterium]
MKNKKMMLGMIVMSLLPLIGAGTGWAQDRVHLRLPALREKAIVTYAPEVPPPIKRKKPAVVEVHLNSSVQIAEIKQGLQYKYWTFDDHVPGPFIRARVGDTLEIHHTSTDASGMPHNVDFHAVTGPGGGAPVTTVVKGEKRVAWFKLLTPGLYIYHCAAPPVMDHIANGMYGLILVEPAKGLPKVDREFYVLQSEFYTNKIASMEAKPVDHEHHGDKKEEAAEDEFWGDEAGAETGPTLLEFSHQAGLDEHPTFVVFNGKYGSLMGEGALKAKVGEKVRIYFGNAGPNLISSFHVIGEIFDKVYREGDLISPPGQGIQSTLVPTGGATVVEFALDVPGTYTLVDHAIFRVEKGAVGFLNVEGPSNPDIFVSDQEAVLCEGCLVHP